MVSKDFKLRLCYLLFSNSELFEKYYLEKTPFTRKARAALRNVDVVFGGKCLSRVLSKTNRPQKAIKPTKSATKSYDTKLGRSCEGKRALCQ